MTIENSQLTQIHPVLAGLGFPHETPIQREVIPVLALGESVLALAPTGSGKTLAFLIPLMERLDSSIAGTQLLVLAPTRELGTQIAQVASQVAARLVGQSGRQLQVRTAFGGQKSDSQKTEILKNPEVVVATPGRALELIGQEVLKTSLLKAIVLDEADIMVGMGFEAQVKMICDLIPQRIQAALFSATESEGQSRLQNRLVHRGQRIDVRQPTAVGSIVEIEKSTQRTRHQTVLIPQGTERLTSLSHLIFQISADVQSGIIFCQTRESVQTVLEDLRAKGISAAALSGELGQIERATIMRLFKSGGVQYLVATNLAARGIDVSDLSVVINFDLPSTQQEYLHRAGRSGRAGKDGWTISLCTRQSQSFLSDLLKGTEISLSPLQKNVEESALPKAAQNFVKIHVNRGKSSKLRPADFLGALTKDLGLGRDDVGGIFIFDHFTHVEVSQLQARKVLTMLPGRRIKNLTVKATEANALAAPRRHDF